MQNLNGIFVIHFVFLNNVISLNPRVGQSILYKMGWKTLCDNQCKYRVVLLSIQWKYTN